MDRLHSYSLHIDEPITSTYNVFVLQRAALIDSFNRDYRADGSLSYPTHLRIVEIERRMDATVAGLPGSGCPG